MVGTKDEHTGDSHNGSLNGSKRASGRLGQPEEHAPADGRISSRRNTPRKLGDIGTPADTPTLGNIGTPVNAPQLGSSGLTAREIEMTATGQYSIPPQDHKPTANAPAQTNPPAPTRSIFSPSQTPKDRAADSTQDIPKPAFENKNSGRTRDSTDKLAPIGKRRPAKEESGLYLISNDQKIQPAPLNGQPANPTDEDYAKDASGSRRVYLSTRGKTACDYLPLKPTLTLTEKVELALAGKRSITKEILSLRHGLITINLSVDPLKGHSCGVVAQETHGKNPALLTLIYHAPRTSKRPDETGIDNAFDSADITQHLTHKDHITNYAIPDAEANGDYVKKCVHLSADASLLGRPGVALAKTIENITTLITHRTTFTTYLSAVCELARSELDARTATRLVLAQGLSWNKKQNAPEGLINAQTMLIDEYDRLIRRWSATYSCGNYLAQEYRLALASTPQDTAKNNTPATGDTMLLTKDAAGATTAVAMPKKK
jgi:hypothetical protein